MSERMLRTRAARLVLKPEGRGFESSSTRFSQIYREFRVTKNICSDKS